MTVSLQVKREWQAVTTGQRRHMGGCPGGHDGGEDGQMATPRQPDTMFFRGRHRGERLLDQRSGEQSVVESIEKIERAVDRGRY